MHNSFRASRFDGDTDRSELRNRPPRRRLRKGVVIRLAARFCASAALVCCVVSARAALADQSSVGISLNATTGHHIESTGTQSVPLVPLPMFEFNYGRKRVHVRAEIVPPIGPVSLGPGPFGYSQEPRLSYLSAEALYYSSNGRYAFGLGETVLNQRTLYPPTPVVQASRVVGTRYSARALLFATSRGSLEAALAVNPSLRGLQYTGAGRASFDDAERGAMVDTALRWSVPTSYFIFSYGLRYVNYSAAYCTTGALADRNNFLLPFVAFDWALRRDPPSDKPEPAFPAPTVEPASPEAAYAGLSLYGSTGSHSLSGGPVTARSFAIVPQFEARKESGRFTLHANGFLPGSVDPFGSSRYTTSYLDAGLSYRPGDGRYAFGLGDTAINQHYNFGEQVAPVQPYFRNRSDGLRYTASATFSPSLGNAFVVEAGVVPYLHMTSYFTGETPQGTVRTVATYYRGSLVDASLRWQHALRRTVFSYGLRYLNQSVLLFRSVPPPGIAPSSVVEHDSSLMPFAGVSLAIGK